MKGWDERKFSNLQYKLEQCILYGKQVTLDGDAFTVMAAYLLGVADCLTGEADEYDLEGLEVKE